MDIKSNLQNQKSDNKKDNKKESGIIKNENNFYKSKFSKKYSISGNLYISSIDLWNFLNNYYENNSENFSKNKFDNTFDFGFSVLNEFATDNSYKIKDKFGIFKINLRKANRTTQLFILQNIKNLLI